jgi:hypothetical protein
MDNITLRNDEIQALSAIYGEEWITEDETNNVYSITLKNDNFLNTNECQQRSQLCERMIRLEFRLPVEYPLEAMPFYTLSAPWMSRMDKIRLMSSLEEIYCSHAKESILYLWIEKAREFLNDNQKDNTSNESSDEKHCQTIEDEENEEEKGVDSSNYMKTLSLGSNELESSHNHNHNDEHHNSHSYSQNAQHNSNVSLYHGEPFIDRRSTFQAHLSPVHCVAEAQEALAILKSNKKIESATHNISAYRISGGPHNTCIQDCDDDGENHAGSRLLHLLQILEVKNVLVVVSRWYGGIQLGPDRFKHINNTARDLLQKCGYIESHDDSNDANHSNQSVKNKKKFK